MKLAGRKAVVTGASQGLGLAIARVFLEEGASVLICARGADELETARAELDAAYPGKVFAERCDVGVEQELDAFAAMAARVLGGVDVLVCNAGVYGPKGAIDTVDWAAWVRAIQINLTGTVYCCRAFLPLLKQASRAKVLIISGGGATKPLPNLSAYAASKAGVVRFAETLAEELKPFGIDVNSIAPGALNTRLLDEILEAGPAVVGEAFYNSAIKQRDTGGTSPELGGRLCAYLASAAGDGVTGRLISAQWDPWERMEAFKDDMAATDVYTLRRIVPADRHKPWEH
ncbi:MAG: SDR family oxidoreductase [Bryobacterales bacterium]|nr:SDR family oxidoreductase [Bryobacterales bacterium]